MIPHDPFDDRLLLPGSRPLWWAVAVAAIVLPLALLMAGTVSDAPATLSTVDFEVRKLNLMWRVTSASEASLAASRKARAGRPAAPGAAAPVAVEAPAGPDAAAPPDAVSQTAAPGPQKPGQSDDGALQARMREGHREAILSLFQLALDVPAGPADEQGGAAAAELVVAHALATEHYDMARELWGRVPTPSVDLSAALAAEVPPPGDLRQRAEQLRAASDVAHGSRFGAQWGAFTRDRVRARVHVLAGRYDRAREVHGRLNASDDTVLSLVRTLWLGLVFAGIFGLLSLLSLGVRAATARSAGRPPLGWLRARFPGLGEQAGYHRDPLVVLLGFATWLMGYVVAGLLVSLIPGARSSGGLAVLFQGLAGVILAWAVISAFSRVNPPIDAARLLGGAEVPAWRASTAALWSYCLLLPIMAPVMLLSGLLAGEQARSHPVVEMMLQGADPIQIASLGLAVVVIAPIGEELLFRGFLYRAVRQHLGPGRALFISASLFALLHLSPSQIAPYLLLGVAFGLVFEWVGSLWASIVLHGLWNAVVFAGVVLVALS